jgi:DNA processing protein
VDEIAGFWAGAQDHGTGVDLGALAEAAGGWAVLVGAGEEGLVRLGVTPLKARAWARTRPRTTRGVALVQSDPRYPDALRLAKGGAPPVLCVQGDLACLSGVAWAVVGTRQCTAYGIAVARHLSSGLAAAGICVVSCLARGIDSHAHRAALAVGRTVAVLGHGLSHTAPPSNRPLRDAIVGGGGLVLSTWADEVEPKPYTFPVRNRWIAGLSDGVVVVEAPTRSGALHTATAAADQGREVWAVPSALGVSTSRGCLDLISQGAAVMVDVDEFVFAVSGRARAPRADWLAALFGGATVDESARVAGRSTAELLASLSRMELAGEVVRLPGQRYAPGGSCR